MKNQATPQAQTHAKALRITMTDSEKKLWAGVRGERLGVKFRRQHSMGSYIADIACLSHKLVVEIDGSQHADQATYDAQRESWIKAQNFDILRFSSRDTPLNTEGVRQSILLRLDCLRNFAGKPPSLPSPDGEGAHTASCVTASIKNTLRNSP